MQSTNKCVTHKNNVCVCVCVCIYIYSVIASKLRTFFIFFSLRPCVRTFFGVMKHITLEMSTELHECRPVISGAFMLSSRVDGMYSLLVPLIEYRKDGRRSEVGFPTFVFSAEFC